MIWAVLTAAVLVGGVGWLRRRWLLVTVTGASMHPTLMPGDRVLVRRASSGRIRAGQIVVMADEVGLIIKRVAAVAGDPVPPGMILGLANRVPPGRLILLGDNPAGSTDSRQCGYFDARRLVGVAVKPFPQKAAPDPIPGRRNA